MNGVGLNPNLVNTNPYLYKNNVNCNYPAFTGEVETQPQYDTTEFSNQAQEELPKNGGTTSRPLFWVTLTALAAVAVLKRGKIAEIVNKLLGKNKDVVSKSAEKAATTLEKAKGKENLGANVPKKQRVKNTSVTGASKPITNESEAKIIQNIETKNANNKSRKLFQQHQNDIVTPQQQAAYDKSIAYVAPTQQEAKAIEQLHKTNANQRVSVNTVENTAKGGKNLTTVKKSIEKVPALKEGINIGKNGDLLTVKNGKVVHIRTKTDGRVITDELKIAKHINKHQVI